MVMDKSLKKILLLSLFVQGIIWADAQVMMQPQLPAQGLIQQNQLWNILVINNGDPASDCIIQLNFQ